MKKYVLFLYLILISTNVFAQNSYQGILETYLKHNDWYVDKSDDKRTFFQVFRDKNNNLVLRTCPTYMASEKNGVRTVVCAAGLTMSANSKTIALQYDEKEKAFVGTLPGIIFNDKIILKGNSERKLQLQFGDEIYLPHNAEGQGQVSS